MKKYIKPIIASSVAVLMLSACVPTTGGATPNAQQGNSTNNTSTGAIVGGLLGAIVGGTTADRSGTRGKRAVMGGAIGAAVGAAVGYSLDQQAKEVAQVLNTSVDNNPQAEQNSNNELVVSNTDKFVKIMFRDPMMFRTNSSTPTPSAQAEIRQMIPVLQKYNNTIIQAVGHTDNRGSYQHNQRLSEARARSVGNTVHSGLKNPVYSKGCSYSKPIAPNTSATNMALNRRVEIYLYPNQASVIDPCRN
ncbi:OmpA family protein [Sulfurovum sp. bin170]|uniref:OmpA family protein n=1 Tax=Sulfurovum sp. bin170 TaxID=2695268 RepID=UPI0013E0234F|nr:OmpA family protein [Sulfurovum sp. bin170]NEW60439.1 OmpA family protein [Sulfurovum sp. bin170]